MLGNEATHATEAEMKQVHFEKFIQASSMEQAHQQATSNGAQIAYVNETETNR
jgi:hypothetical protein